MRGDDALGAQTAGPAFWEHALAAGVSGPGCLPSPGTWSNGASEVSLRQNHQPLRS